MRMRSMAVAAAGGVMIFAGAGQASAGGCDYGECYQKVQLPDEYATVAGPVVVRPASNEVVHEPAIVTTRQQRIETQPGYWVAEKVPAQVGSVTKAVMVRPATVHHETIPAEYRTVHETVVVRPAGWRWEYSVDRFGRETKCKVEVPAVTRTIARRVMVAPARTVVHTNPAVYKTVTRPLLIAPAKVRHTYVPPRHAWVEHPMVIKPATQRVIHHPAVVGVVHEDVVVRRGGAAWVPAHRHHF